MADGSRSDGETGEIIHSFRGDEGNCKELLRSRVSRQDARGCAVSLAQAVGGERDGASRGGVLEGDVHGILSAVCSVRNEQRGIEKLIGGVARNLRGCSDHKISVVDIRAYGFDLQSRVKARDVPVGRDDDRNRVRSVDLTRGNNGTNRVG